MDWELESFILMVIMLEVLLFLLMHLMVDGLSTRLLSCQLHFSKMITMNLKRLLLIVFKFALTL